MKKSVSALLLTVCISLTTVAAEDRTTPKILCWGPGYSLVLDALYMFPEAADALIAMGKGNQAGGSFQEILDPAYSGKAVLAMELQPETVAAYNPSHVILKGYMRKAAKNIETLGIPVYYIDMESPEQYDRDLTLMGEIFNNPERAEELKSYFKTERLAVENTTSGIAASEKPGVLFLYHSMKGGSLTLKVPPAGWIQTRMVEWAGGVPVWTDAVSERSWQTVSFEQIAAWDPDTIFVVSYHTDVADVKEQLKKDPLWKMLRAEQNDRLYAFPGDFLSWDQPDPRWILGMYWIGSKLHPQLFSEALLESKLYQFYSTAYGFSKADVDEIILPKITGDYR
ncbi:MAG: ABC transporter substrate-binding protein [Spirochaetales bacterium]|nr:ABC transporter substrate-binding protein [Spirochaetales bacterium]